MVDDPKQSIQEQNPENSASVTQIDTGLTQTKKPRISIWTIFGVIAGIVFLCLAIVITNIIISSKKTAVEEAAITSVLDNYMKYMAARDVTNAYALFSPEFKEVYSLSDIEGLTKGDTYELFDGYQSLFIQVSRFSTVVSTEKPIRDVARISGTISYKGNIQGVFESTFEKLDDKWKISRIKITVPPAKLEQ
ncbi:MAG: nuclear transport factor 2 family protein [Anaerolineales bacterium]|uniref:nuclear transport factor 2 family protein n=1 Tax=Candidatus Villigracilis proximus TaxID=3140683 RepID=UPI00313639FF|nr:nuclear transport factor 2 family protein [Anaerolineales bacterium]